jgi:hypothetical protein
MKYIIILSIILSSCVTYHKKQIDKHTEKLLSKGVVIPKDTIEVRVSDTIIKSFTRNDTTFVKKLITNTITLEPIVEYKTRWQTKIEYKTKVKTERIKGKTIVKTQRIEAKQKKSWWLFWLLLGFSLLAIVYLIVIASRLKTYLMKT